MSCINQNKIYRQKTFNITHNFKENTNYQFEIDFSGELDFDADTVQVKNYVSSLAVIPPPNTEITLNPLTQGRTNINILNGGFTVEKEKEGKNKVFTGLLSNETFDQDEPIDISFNISNLNGRTCSFGIVSDEYLDVSNDITGANNSIYWDLDNQEILGTFTTPTPPVITAVSGSGDIRRMYMKDGILKYYRWDGVNWISVVSITIPTDTYRFYVGDTDDGKDGEWNITYSNIPATYEPFQDTICLLSGNVIKDNSFFSPSNPNPLIDKTLFYFKYDGNIVVQTIDLSYELEGFNTTKKIIFTFHHLEGSDTGYVNLTEINDGLLTFSLNFIKHTNTLTI